MLKYLPEPMNVTYSLLLFSASILVFNDGKILMQVTSESEVKVLLDMAMFSNTIGWVFVYAAIELLLSGRVFKLIVGKLVIPLIKNIISEERYNRIEEKLNKIDEDNKEVVD